MDNTRDITNSDLWSAIRGLGMYGMTRDELIALAVEHERLSNVGRDAFASRVIAEAARQVAATKRGCEQ
jgi:hypothetical protein